MGPTSLLYYYITYDRNIIDIEVNYSIKIINKF